MIVTEVFAVKGVFLFHESIVKACFFSINEQLIITFHTCGVVTLSKLQFHMQSKTLRIRLMTKFRVCQEYRFWDSKGLDLVFHRLYLHKKEDENTSSILVVKIGKMKKREFLFPGKVVPVDWVRENVLVCKKLRGRREFLFELV